jgi:tetratricopeptide (TPR) repeat protein
MNKGYRKYTLQVRYICPLTRTFSHQFLIQLFYMKNMHFISTIALLFLLSFGSNAQQLKTPASSPLQTLEQNFALSTIKIEYSRPSAKGRTVFGDLVPFGKIWRTGANASTKVTFGEDVTIQGNALPAGTYAMYTIPNRDSWEILFYSDLKLGGNVADYNPENEVLRVKASVNPYPIKTETFTINVAEITASAAAIEILWENTRIALNVTADIDSKIMKNIETALAADNRPYFQAATYYHDNNKDLAKALEWANKAIELNPKAFYMVHLKAKIQLKMKDYKGAIATAEQSIALSKEAENDDYVAMNQKLIMEAQKGK